ncbi:MAG: SurA N-terminal domain-containing protein [Proteobacteria bacterium]|nr:SurA N-terminal domain-containing protein [Pseudomonadota bacterium]MBU1716461.1 SurA N-terminal domain-containing protein [Pseudomonadota bacterium]
MLDLLRRKAQSTYIQVVIVIIILVFVFWGVGTNNGTGQNVVAMVNDDSVSLPEYQRAYDRTINEYRKQLGGTIPANLLESLGIKEKVINDLVQMTLVRQGAREMGLMVSDEDVRKAIQEMEAFKNESGIFDLNEYQQILAGSRLSVSDFEDSMKEDLLTGKVMSHLAGLAQVPEPEMARRFAYDYEEMRFSYVSFDAADFKKKVEVKDDELAAFFDLNKDKYKTASQIKVKYLTFPFVATGGWEQFSQEQIKEYYQEHISDYTVPEKRRSRHVLIKMAEDDSDAVKSEKRSKAEDVLAQAIAGKDFAELAKEYSDDTSSAQGGDLGFFTRGQTVKSFDDRLFSMKEGDIDLVQSPFGLHVLKLEEIQAAQTTPLEQVKESMVLKMQQEDGRKMASKQADAAYEKIILSGSIDNYSKEAGVEIKETGFFGRQKPPAILANDTVFLNAAFSLKKGELSSLIEGERAYAIIFVDDIEEPEVPALATVRDQVENDFVADRARAMAQEAAESLLGALKNGAGLESEAEKAGVKVEVSSYVSRATNSAEQKLPAKLMTAALELTEVAPYPETIGVDGDKYYVLVFKDKKEAPADLFADKKDELRNKLMDETKTNLLNAWIAYLRSRAEIKINTQF